MTTRNRFGVGSAKVAASPAESAVLALSPPIRWREISSVLKSYAEPLADKLVANGLLMTNAERGNIRFWATLPYVTLLAFGATKGIIGDLRERPVGYLTVLLIVTAFLAAIRWFTIDRHTEAGRDAVARAVEQSRRLKAASTTSEMDLAVALFGTAVLAGSGIGDFH
jgi:uncharacterized protein (TIGR04222 family)